MDNTLKSSLSCLVNAKEICCLCLRDTTDECVLTNDMIYVPFINAKPWVVLIEILEEILNADESEITSFSNVLCKDCYKIAITTYKLINRWNITKQFLSKLVDSVTLCFDEDNPNYTNNMYISINREMKCTKTYQKSTKQKIQKHSKKARKPKMPKNGLFSIEIKVEPSFEDNISDGDKLICSECSLKCPNTKVMRMHLLREHAPKEFTCDKCPNSFSTEFLLKRHTTKNHRNIVCSICGKIYNSLQSLKTHQYTHQSLSCDLCGRSYKTISSYKKHISTKKCTQQKDTNLRTLQKLYQCDNCQKSYVNNATLKTHIKFEHGSGIYLQCQWCDKKFNSQSRLNMHIVTHTKEKSFTCNTCDRQFVTKEALLYHTRIHTGETPYKCPHCDLKFLSTSRRMDHIRRKHTAPSIPCDFCASKFTTACALRKHVKKHLDPSSKLYSGAVATLGNDDRQPRLL